MQRYSLSILLFSALASLPMGVQAMPITFTQHGDFLAAAGGTVQVEDFESQAPGQVASGNAIGSLRVNYDFGGVQLSVTDGAQHGGGGPFNTVSGTQFLGTDDADSLQSGDNITFGFANSFAVGMFFVTSELPDPSCSMAAAIICDGDIVLRAAGVTAQLSVSDVQLSIPGGESVFFLGIVDNMGSFNSASLESICCGFFNFYVDDFSTAATAPSNVTVSSPATWLLALIGLFSMLRRSASRG